MEIQRSFIANKYHSIELYDCSIDVLLILSKKVKADVTVENIIPVRYRDEWFKSKQSLFPGSKVSNHNLRNVCFDAALTNSEFVDNMKFWDQNGVFAVFTEKSPVAFKVSHLDGPARYKALDNFGFIMLFAMDGPSGGGWSEIVSPDSELISIAEEVFQKS